MLPLRHRRKDALVFKSVRHGIGRRGVVPNVIKKSRILLSNQKVPCPAIEGVRRRTPQGLTAKIHSVKILVRRDDVYVFGANPEIKWDHKAVEVNGIENAQVLRLTYCQLGASQDFASPWAIFCFVRRNNHDTFQMDRG